MQIEPGQFVQLDCYIETIRVLTYPELVDKNSKMVVSVYENGKNCDNKYITKILKEEKHSEKSLALRRPGSTYGVRIRGICTKTDMIHHISVDISCTGGTIVTAYIGEPICYDDRKNDIAEQIMRNYMHAVDYQNAKSLEDFCLNHSKLETATYYRTTNKEIVQRLLDANKRYGITLPDWCHERKPVSKNQYYRTKEPPIYELRKAYETMTDEEMLHHFQTRINTLNRWLLTAFENGTIVPGGKHPITLDTIIPMEMPKLFSEKATPVSPQMTVDEKVSMYQKSIRSKKTFQLPIKPHSWGLHTHTKYCYKTMCDRQMPEILDTQHEPDYQPEVKQPHYYDKNRNRQPIPSAATLIRMNETMLHQEIADHFGVNVSSVIRWLQYYKNMGINIKSHYAPRKHPKDRNTVHMPSPEKLAEVLRTHDTKETLEHFGVDEETLNLWVETYKQSELPAYLQLYFENIRSEQNI